MPTGDFDCDSDQLNHVLQLIQLGSECREEVNLLDVPSGSAFGHAPLTKRQLREKSNAGGEWCRLSVSGRGDMRSASYSEKGAGYPTTPTSSSLPGFEPSLHTSLDNLTKSLTQQLKTSSTPSWLSRKKRDVMDNWSSHGGVPGRYFRTSDRVDSLESSPVHLSHTHTRTVEVEVHTEDDGPSSPPRCDGVMSSLKDEGYHNNLFKVGSTLVRDEEHTDGPIERSMNIQTPSLPDHSQVFVIEQTTSTELTPSACSNLGNELTTVRSEVMQSSASNHGSSLISGNPFLASSEKFFSVEHVQLLEDNFYKNHNIADSASPPREAVKEIVRQGQVRDCQLVASVAC